jgi:hypothetical protein
MPRAEILSTQAMHTLRQLHAELAGKLINAKAESKRIVRDMKQVEAVMKLLQPGYSVRSIAVRRRKPNPWFKRGTLFRHVLDALRQAAGPMTAREITDAVLTARGVGDVSKTDQRNLVGSVQSCLHAHEGKTVRNVAEGMPGQWIII